MEVVCGSFAQKDGVQRMTIGRAGYVGLHWLYRTTFILLAIFIFGRFFL